jgi:hypothetical protein
VSKMRTFAIDAVITVEAPDFDTAMEIAGIATGYMIDSKYPQAGAEAGVTRVEFFDGDEVTE